MMFYERELRKIFTIDANLSDVKFIGNTCYGKFSGDLRMKAYFIDRDSFQIKILNRRSGPVDSLQLNLSDLWGKVVSIREDVGAHEIRWDINKPDDADYMKLMAAVNDYLSMFE